jgi:TatD DNase family protein
LDFFLKNTDREKQQYYFEIQLHIAVEYQLPVLLHVRKAHDEIIHTLKILQFKEGGIVHAFNGSEQQAKKYIDLGLKLGFGGAMTFSRAAKLHKLAAHLPLESIVLETDAPDMPPVTCTSSYNTPLHIFDNFRYLLTLRKESPYVTAEQITQNALTLFKLNLCVS